MSDEKRTHVVLALEQADINDQGLAAARQFLDPQRTAVSLVHVAERPAVAGVARGTVDERVLDRKSSQGILHETQREDVTAPREAVEADERGLLAPSAQIEESARRRLAAAFDPALNSLNADGYQSQVIIRFGDPVREILDVSERAKADMIIVATRGRSGMSRLVSRSIPEGVLRGSSIPVLVAHSEP